jgi:glycopeptide antibiotics resistance protein
MEEIGSMKYWIVTVIILLLEIALLVYLYISTDIPTWLLTILGGIMGWFTPQLVRDIT